MDVTVYTLLCAIRQAWVGTPQFIDYLALLLIATLNYILNKAELDITSEIILQYLKWQKKGTIDIDEKMVEKTTNASLEANEILETIEGVKII